MPAAARSATRLRRRLQDTLTLSYLAPRRTRSTAPSRRHGRITKRCATPGGGGRALDFLCVPAMQRKGCHRHVTNCRTLIPCGMTEDATTMHYQFEVSRDSTQLMHCKRVADIIPCVDGIDNLVSCCNTSASICSVHQGVACRAQFLLRVRTPQFAVGSSYAHFD
jgi:hypothetical protein